MDGLIDTNPFKQSVEEQLATLRRQNELGGWGIEESVFARLAETAPEWPEGRDAYRSFRIRFGEGRNGVIKTFDAHIYAAGHAHHRRFRRNWELNLSEEYDDEPVECLRLLNGDDSHNPVIEWITIPDLSAHRERDSITAVRGPGSLADEGLVLAWLVPDRVRAIGRKEWSSWACAGYELAVPEYCGRALQFVPCVTRCLNYGTTVMTALSFSYARTSCSVPPAG